jgi:formylglycine-generating enzyme required for sulfatase activity
MTPPTKLPTKLPTDPRYRVFRGGAWGYSVAAWVRAAARSSDAPSDRYGDFGFRTTQCGCRLPLKG